jgi:hypothetical protein
MKALSLMMLVMLLIGAALADQSRIDKVPIRNLSLVSDRTECYSRERGNPSNVGFPSEAMALNTLSELDLIGTTEQVGTTWYDFQHNGTAGRMIKIDDFGNIHVCWTNGLDLGASSRHVYYNMKNQSGWIWGMTGIGVEATPRGGYTCLNVDQDGYPFVAFHATSGSITRSAVAVDLFPGSGAFQFWFCPDVNNREIIWPRMTVDRQGRCQLVNTENDGTDYSSPLWYVRGVFDPSIPVIEFSNYEYITAVECVAADIAASRHSNRVAIAYSHPQTTLEGDTNQYNNDIYLYVSEDGVTWDWENPTNVTCFLQADTTLLPDTAAANMDTLRAYDDCSVIFDEDDNIHVAFTTPYYDSIRRLVSINNSLIWHWSEELGWFPSLVADGWWGGVPFECGAWQRFVQRPCLAIDTTTADLFITYQHYDTAEVSEGGYPQGDVYVSRSIDNGRHWSVGINVTDTGVPNAPPGQCLSERDITCNETIEDNTLHMFYILDRDAGGVVGTIPEGTWTLNPAMYHRVIIDSIPAAPLMPESPFHVPVLPEHHENVPSTFRLEQNYPNPFNPSTIIRFNLERPDMVMLKVYNILGREVRTLAEGYLQAGTYRLNFNASDLASGVYFYRLSTSSQLLTRKMVLIK